MKKETMLSEINVDPNPFRQFEKWYGEHLNADVTYTNAVTLGTSSPDGHVSVRTVLLKDFSETGFVFFTNYNSKKGKQLYQNPYASMLFYWTESGRQVRIEGAVEKISEEESEAYFRARPRESQIGAWASQQSTLIPDRQHLEKLVEFYENKFEGRAVDKPGHWGGFSLVPDFIEFWQERKSRLHDRIVYIRSGPQWQIKRLAP